MALIQVPYNNAMRLGQGFNTYTQEICIDNAVVGISTNEDSQPITPAPAVPIAQDTSSAVVTPDSSSVALTTTSKEPISSIMSRSLNSVTTQYPSQIVTYYTKYVDKLSDVSSNMNVSGALSVKYGAISGSGAGSYVDAETFQQSDVNFLISVKVINQTINVKDQLQFWPLPADQNNKDLSAADFTKTYGDSFISGFQEGGQFFAIVSIKSLDASKKTDIKASAQLALQVGAGSVDASGSVEMAKADLQKNSEINITVNWSGGGQLKEGGEKWDVDTLTEVAVRFPDLVAACPQRTHAILTKYTALRGYLEWKGTKPVNPLDYELASLYTADLLDVYMGFKVVWDEIHNMLDAMDTGAATYFKAAEPTMPVYMPKVPTNKGWVNGDQLYPFEASYQGFDDAILRCRMLMIRIVREVEDITVRPDFAVDWTRPVAYIRSQVFKQLLPLLTAPSQQRAIIGQKEVSFDPMSTEQVAKRAVSFGYPAFRNQPTVVVGLSRIDVNPVPIPGKSEQVEVDPGVNGNAIFETHVGPSPGNFPLCVQTYASTVGLSNANLNMSIVPDGIAPGVVSKGLTGQQCVSALAIASDDRGLQAGTYTMPWRRTEDGSTIPQDYLERIEFNEPYDVAPKVLVWLSGFERTQKPGSGTVDLRVGTSSIDTTGFTVETHVKVGDLNMVSVAWLAIPSNAPGIVCGSRDFTTFTDSGVYSSGLPYGQVAFSEGTFEKPPQVHIAMNSFAFGGNGPLSIQTWSENVTAHGFDWEAQCYWNVDANIIDAGVSWIAFE